MLLLGILCSGCALSKPGAALVTGTAMGTSYRLRLNCDLNRDVAKQVTEAAFARVDESMSTYRRDSELMRFNASPIGQWRQIGVEFAEVIRAAIEVARLSDGAFDPTLGALLRLWGFSGGEVPDATPSVQEIERRLVESGIVGLELESGEGRIRRLSDFELDLSAIAKGYAVDLAIRDLEKSACRDLLLEVGGEVGVRGSRPDGDAWTVGIESPSKAGSVTHAVTLSNEAIATSGDYRNRVAIEGQVYSHTIDPATGRPVSHDLASVSVISANAMRADALATALNVMGPSSGLEFARRHQIEAFFIIRTENGYHSVGTGRFGSL